MVNYILRRLVISVLVIIAIAITSFFIIQLPPGDFATTYKAFLLQTGNMTEDKAEEMTQLVRAQYGLDQPVYMQFLTWIKGIVTEGKFGYSFAYRTDAGAIIMDRLPKTLMLALLAHLTSIHCGDRCRHLRRAAPVWHGGQYSERDCLYSDLSAALLYGAGHSVSAGLYL